MVQSFSDTVYNDEYPGLHKK